MPIKDMLETTLKMEIKEFRVTQDLRDEIRNLRLLIAAIIKSQGGQLYVSRRTLQSILTTDTFTQRSDDPYDRVILTYVPYPYNKTTEHKDADDSE